EAIGPLDPVVGLLLVLLFRFRLALALDGENAVRERHVDVLLVDAGHIGGNLDLLVGLADINLRYHLAAAVAPEAATRPEAAKVPHEIFEQAVDLPVEFRQRTRQETPPSRGAATFSQSFTGHFNLLLAWDPCLICFFHTCAFEARAA